MEEEILEMEREFDGALKRKNKILRLLQMEVDHYQEQCDKLEAEAAELRPLSKQGLEEIYDWKQRKDELSKSKRITDIKKKSGKAAKAMEKIVGEDSLDDEDDDSDDVLERILSENKPSTATGKKPGSGGAKASTSRVGSGGSTGSGKSVLSRSSAKKETMTRSRSDTTLSKHNTDSPARPRKTVKKKTTKTKA